MNNQLEKLKHLFYSEQYVETINESDRIIELVGGEAADIYDIRAMALESLGYYIDAIEDYSKDLFIHPENANTYFLRGMANKQIGEYDSAKKDVEKAIILNPNEKLYAQSLLGITMFTSNPFMLEMSKKRGVEKSKLIRWIK